jgi:FAD/FMN-containing dehydrogenase
LQVPALERFRSSFRGELVLPPAEEPGTLVARCAGVVDVVRAVELARDEGIAVSVGRSARPDDVVVDLSRLRGIRLDLVGRRVTVEAGVTWGDLDHETQAYGLATTGDVLPSRRVVATALRRGFGWLMRKHGPTCDNILAADVVTSDGRFVRASPDELGALRSGGVVTALELELHPVGPAVTAGVVVFSGDGARDVLSSYRAWSEDAPAGLTTLVASAGQAAAVAGCFAGCGAAAARAFRALEELGAPLEDAVRTRRYTDVQASLLFELVSDNNR